MSESTLAIDSLIKPTEDVLDGLNAILPDLSPKYQVVPLTMEQLSRVTSSSADLLVARHVGEVVGTATIGYFETIEASDAWLSDMVIGSQHQGKGFGRQLLRAVYDCAHSRGAQRIGWTSGWQRSAAHGLYVESGATQRNTSVFMKQLV